MRKWKRVETADGPRFRSSLAPHEAALLHNLVDVDDRLARRTRILFARRRTRRDHRDQDRQFGTPEDRHDAAAAARFLPPQTDTRPDPGRAEASTPRCAACTSRRSSTPNVLRHNSCWTPFRQAADGSSSPRTTPTPGLPRSTTFGWRWARMLEIGPDGPERLPDRPSDGRPPRRLPVADRAAGVPGAGADGQALSR